MCRVELCSVVLILYHCFFDSLCFVVILMQDFLVTHQFFLKNIVVISNFNTSKSKQEKTKGNAITSSLLKRSNVHTFEDKNSLTRLPPLVQQSHTKKTLNQQRIQSKISSKMVKTYIHISYIFLIKHTYTFLVQLEIIAAVVGWLIFFFWQRKE